jgi:hypothetical protein
MPVVDEVSEGDLIGRDEARAKRGLIGGSPSLAEGVTLSEDFLASLRTSERRAGGIISTSVITVGENRHRRDSPSNARVLAKLRARDWPSFCSSH